MSWKVRRLPKATNKEFTLADLLQAIEDDGLPQALYSFWQASDGKTSQELGEEFEVGAGCAIGQGALNLGVHYNDLVTALFSVRTGKRGRPLSESIIQRNDDSHWNIEKIAQHYRKRFADQLEIKFELPVQYEVIKDTNNG